MAIDRDIRRVVTGHRDGKAVFASDEVVPAVEFGGGGAFHLLWGGDTTPQYPDDGSLPQWSAVFPPVGGRRFLLLTLPPDRAGNGAGTPGGLDEALAESLADVVEPDEPGMHTTATIDFEVVLSGEVTLELDDGAEVTLRPHDCVVQNGTRHRWHNRGTEPATMVVFMNGAEHEAVG